MLQSFVLNFSSNKKLYSCQFENCARWIVVKCCIISRTKLIINIRRYLFLNIASKKKIYKNRPRSNNDNELKIPISLISKKREKQFPHPSCNPPKIPPWSDQLKLKFRSFRSLFFEISIERERPRAILPKQNPSPPPSSPARRISKDLSLSLSFSRRRRRISGRGGFARGGVDRYFFTAGQEESGAEESRLGSQCSLFASSNSVDRSDEPDWPCSNTSRSKPSSSSLTFLPTPSSYSSLLLLCYPETRRDL